MPRPVVTDGNGVATLAGGTRYGVITVLPVCCAPVEVVMVTVTVNGPLPATYDFVCWLLVVSAVPLVPWKAQW